MVVDFDILSDIGVYEWNGVYLFVFVLTQTFGYLYDFVIFQFFLYCYYQTLLYILS